MASPNKRMLSALLLYRYFLHESPIDYPYKHEMMMGTLCAVIDILTHNNYEKIDNEHIIKKIKDFYFYSYFKSWYEGLPEKFDTALNELINSTFTAMISQHTNSLKGSNTETEDIF